VTTAEQLAEVQAAISRVLTGGQAHSAEGRALTRADLTALQARESLLKATLARETRGSAVTYGVPV
jgi:hypothetical protein